MIKSFAWVWSQEADMPNYDYGISPEIHTKYRRETLDNSLDLAFMDLWVWKNAVKYFSLPQFFWRPADMKANVRLHSVNTMWMHSEAEPRSASNEWSKLAIHLFAWAKDHQQVVEGALLDSAELVYDPDIMKHWLILMGWSWSVMQHLTLEHCASRSTESSVI